MAWPVRTGLPTVNNLLKVVKRILNKFMEIYTTILTPTQLAKVVALLECIQDFLSDVPSHEPEE